MFVRTALDTDALAAGLAERAAIESGGNPQLLLQAAADVPAARPAGARGRPGLVVRRRAGGVRQPGSGSRGQRPQPGGAAEPRRARRAGPRGRVRVGVLDRRGGGAGTPARRSARQHRGVRPRSGHRGGARDAGPSGRARLRPGAARLDRAGRDRMVVLPRAGARPGAGDAGSRGGPPPPAVRRPVAGGADAAAPEQRAAGDCWATCTTRAATCAAPASASWPPATRPCAACATNGRAACTCAGCELLDIDDSVRKMDAYHKLGDVSVRLGRAHEALAHFGEMLRIAWQLDLPAKGGAAHARIGRLHRALGDFRRALSHLELAHTLFELAGDRPGIAAVLDDTGRIHLLKGNFEQSMTHHQAALGIREELQRRARPGADPVLDGAVRDAAGQPGAGRRLLPPRAGAVPGHARRTRHRVRAAGPRPPGARGRPARPAPARAWRRRARWPGRWASACTSATSAWRWASACWHERRPADAELEFAAVRSTAQQFGARRLAAEAARALAEARLAQGDVLRRPGSRLLGAERRRRRWAPRRWPGPPCACWPAPWPRAPRATPTTADRARCSTGRSSCWKGWAPSWSWGGRSPPMPSSRTPPAAPTPPASCGAGPRASASGPGRGIRRHRPVSALTQPDPLQMLPTATTMMAGA